MRVEEKRNEMIRELMIEVALLENHYQDSLKKIYQDELCFNYLTEYEKAFYIALFIGLQELEKEIKHLKMRARLLRKRK